LACTKILYSNVDVFCRSCKTPVPPDWTTGNQSLDSFITKSWNNIDGTKPANSYLKWVEYSRLTNIQELSSLDHGCTHTADWFERSVKGHRLIKVVFKKIVDGENAQSFDFYQVIISFLLAVY